MNLPVTRWTTVGSSALVLGLLGATSPVARGVDNVGRVTVYTYSNFSVATQRTYFASDATNNRLSETRYFYDQLGRQTASRTLADCKGRTATSADQITVYAYDVAGNISKEARKTGTNVAFSVETGDDVATNSYDSLNRRVSMTRSEGAETLYEYDLSGNVTKTRVRKGSAAYIDTYAEYDVLNRATKHVDGEGHYREVVYDSRSLRVKEFGRSSAGARLSQDRWFYDSAARAISTISYLDPNDDTTTVGEGANRVVKYDYDGAGRVVTETTYNNNSSTAIQVASLYDGHGRLTRTETPPGSTSTDAIDTYEYDKAGVVTRQIVGMVPGANGARTALYSYDGWHRMTQKVNIGTKALDNLTTSYAYDGLDRIATTTDPASQATSYSYDGFGLQTRKTENVGGLARPTDSKYDRLGRIITLTAYDNHPSAQTQHTVYVYGGSTCGSARSRRVIYPDDQYACYDYDEAGRLVFSEGPGTPNISYYEYDDRGGVISTAPGIGANAKAFGYDALGRMTLAKAGTNSPAFDNVSKTQLEYDALSRVTRETQELFAEGAANAKTFQYSYDQVGNRLGLLFESSKVAELSLAYQYDSLSRNTKVRGKFQNSTTSPPPLTDYEDMIQYDFSGRELSRRRLTTLYRYEAGSPYPANVYLDYRPLTDYHGRVWTIFNETYFGGACLDELAKFSYMFDGAGNRLENIGNRGTSGHNAAGFATIQHISDYDYDSLHRLTDVEYDISRNGQTLKHEAYEYDNLGNRITYADQRNSTTTAYTNNIVNEYTQIGPPGALASVTYSALGNLSRGEDNYVYTYDEHHRLLTVAYDPGGTSTQVASFAYDALGRMISSYTRFDAVDNGEEETVKYYYDGQNAIAEYDLTNNVSRRYIHGTQRIDERAIMITGSSPSTDTFYYLLQELDTVTGLMAKNGRLVEAYSYDGYGKPTIREYRVLDFNRDGDQDSSGTYNDWCYFFSPNMASPNCPNADCCSTVGVYLGTPGADPQADISGDGLVDLIDYSLSSSSYTVPGASPPQRYISTVGNPYFFTGRNVHFLEASFTGDPAENKPVQHNRARHYDPISGRWLQRDPLAYVDGSNLYEYVRSRPSHGLDPFGLRDWLDHLSDFVAGVGDSLAFGLTREVRSALEWAVFDGDWDDPQVNPDSGFYVAGEIVEVTVEIAVTAGGATLRHIAKHTSREAVEGGARRVFRRTNKIEGGIVHHINPILGHPGGSPARFPLPFRSAARGHWNMTHITSGSRAGDEAAHLAVHRYLMRLESLDRARTATMGVRQAGNAILAHAGCECREPSISITANFRGEAIIDPIGYPGGGYATLHAGAAVGGVSTISCHAGR